MTDSALHTLQVKLIDSIFFSEYGDIRSILDEFLPHPLWSEQVAMTTYLTKHVKGALFEYEHTIGWSYVEDGE